MSDKKRILKNTIMLYIRQILILFVSLYTVRVVLNTLGVEDYGIYSTVGGIVTFFSFLSTSMASATQRYFSYALGEENQDKLYKSFTTNIIIYMLIAVIAIFLLESFGLWFIYNKLNVSQDRFSAAVWVFHFSVLTFVFNIFSCPFMAIIIAHENMEIYAYVSIVEAILKLLLVFLLNFILWDKLKLYAVLLSIAGFFISTLYILICLRKYKECKFRISFWDRSLFIETINFTGWTLFGQLTSVLRTQAVTILINQVFNPTVVAARTIAMNVSNQINIFSNNFNTGLYPSIIKSYASKNKNDMYELVFQGCKICFILIWVFMLPLFCEMNFVLKLWLGKPPENAILFTRLALFEVLINCISLPVATAARAPGKMRNYELCLGCIQILIFVTDYMLLRFFQLPAFLVFIVAAVGNVLMMFGRIIIVHNLVGLPLRKYICNVLGPIFISIIITSILSFFVMVFIKCEASVISIVRILLITIINMVVCFCILFDKKQRKEIVEKIMRKFKSKI